MASHDDSTAAQGAPAAEHIQRARAALAKARQEFEAAAEEHTEQRQSSRAKLQRSIDAVYGEMKDKVEMYRYVAASEHDSLAPLELWISRSACRLCR